MGGFAQTQIRGQKQKSAYSKAAIDDDKVVSTQKQWAQSWSMKNLVAKQDMQEKEKNTAPDGADKRG